MMTRLPTPRVVLMAVACAAATVLSPAALKGRTTYTITAQQKAADPDYEATFKPLRFREIGPATMGGRIDDFAVVESNPDIIYVATASGGVFKSVNGGTTWEPIFDNEAVSTIGDITLAPSDPSIVWVGTGEANNRQSSSWGNGVYRSTDAGRTWTHMGLADTHHIARIVIHPTDPNTLYVAAVGRLWGPSKERGLYKTTDGGKTWNNVLFVNEDTGVTDVALDHESPGTLIAAAYQRRRTVFGFNGSGPHGGLHKTTDGGATWKKLEKGLPWDASPPEAPRGFGRGSGGGFGGGGFGGQPQAQQPPRPIAPEAMKEIGRIGVSFYRKNTNILYALVEHAGGGIFRSDDKGETWTKQSDTNPRPMYYSQLFIDPQNDQRVWVHGASLMYTEDGGRTFRVMAQRVHSDFHAMWINPQNSDQIILGGDGGIAATRDRGRTWEVVNNIPLAQFYEIGLDMAKPYNVCGGLQDNNTWCGPSGTMDTRGIANSDWFTIGGGDGFYAQVDSTDPTIVYAESQDGNVLRRNLKTHEARSIRPQHGENDPPYRFQWNSPIVISAHDPKTIYYGGNFLFRSADRGDSWTRLGPDLTTGVERNKLPIMGKVPDRYTMSRHDGVQNYPAITTSSESALNKDVLWAGTDDGNLQVTRDGGKTWRNVAEHAKGVPKGTYVSRVIASRHAEGTAYATFDGHRSNDFGIYVFMTTDYGDTWKAIRNGIPDNKGTVNVIREHHRNPRLLFAGTEYGLYVSFDQGSRWSRLKLNLPIVPVDDIAIHPRENDLVLATHGRSIWMLDDITPLEQMAEKTLTQDLHLFDLRTATQWRITSKSGSTAGGNKAFLGANPPNGAIVHYFLKTKPAERERVRITVQDSGGRTIRELDGTAAAGINRVVWDLRSRSPLAAPSGGPAGASADVGRTQAGVPPSAESSETEQQQVAAVFGFGGGGFGGSAGSRVEPGEYTVKVSVGKLEQSKKVLVEEDPRIVITPQDRLTRRQTIDRITQLLTPAIAAQRSITGLRTSLNTEIEGWRRPGARAPENVRKAADDLLQRVDATCRKFASAAQCGERGAGGQGSAGPPLVAARPSLTQRLGSLMSAIENFMAAPTAWQLEQIPILEKQLKDAEPDVRKLVQEDLPALNKLMNDAGMPHIAPAAAGRPGTSTSNP
jgi:photosystem II stability/assembly factor-like uncharacterized protein